MAHRDFPSSRLRSAIRRYGIALLSVAIATGCSLVLRHFDIRLTPFLLAVGATVWYAGAGPGAAAIILSIFCLDYVVLPPARAVSLFSTTGLVYLISFTVFAVIVWWAAGTRRRAEQQLREARDELDAKVLERTAELQRSGQAHLHFLQSLDRVNRAIQGANDPEQMMSGVLDTVLSIFDCDRAWLVYPCDPEAATWRVLMEHTRADFPGAFALGVDLPVDAQVAATYRAVRASSDPVTFGPDTDPPIPAQVAEEFSIRSAIGMAIYPKVGKPYMFGLHQCSYPRIWTPAEEELLREIGRRMADALTGLLMFRNLEESEAKLEEAQRIAHVGYWDYQPGPGLVTWSDESYRIFGREPGEGPVAFAQFQEHVHPEDRQRIIAALAEALAGGRRYDVEFRVVRPNDEVRLVHSRGVVVKNESGPPRRMFGIVQDITERKRTETALREAQTELAHVNRVTTMGQLAASIAHEVNQPIAATVTNANAALRWLGAQPPELEEVRQALVDIIKDGGRAGEVIGRIRSLVRKVPPRHDPVDINDAIHDVIEVTRPDLLEKGVTLYAEFANALPPICGDRVQLQQVALNLIVNAAEAMKDAPGGIMRELRISTAEDPSNGVRVEVGNSGPGLSPETLERLFDPFYTTKPGGMGMGLSICASIIEAHGGRIWATANVPQGAVFHFTLPVGEGS